MRLVYSSPLFGMCLAAPTISLICGSFGLDLLPWPERALRLYETTVAPLASFNALRLLSVPQWAIDVHFLSLTGAFFTMNVIHAVMLDALNSAAKSKEIDDFAKVVDDPGESNSTDRLSLLRKHLPAIQIVASLLTALLTIPLALFFGWLGFGLLFFVGLLMVSFVGPVSATDSPEWMQKGLRLQSRIRVLQAGVVAAIFISVFFLMNSPETLPWITSAFTSASAILSDAVARS